MRGLSASIGHGGFSPASLADLGVWYRADKVVLSGSLVTTLTDLSGNGHNATGGTSPTYNATDAGYNGQPTVSFLGSSSQYLAAAGVSLSQPGTIYVVGEGTGANGGFLDGSTARWALVILSSQLVAFAGSVLTDTGIDPTTKTVMWTIINGGSSSLGHNAVTADVSGAAGAGAFTGLLLGTENGLSSYLTGKIAEVIICTTSHSSTTRTKVLNYLGARYGVSIGP